MHVLLEDSKVKTYINKQTRTLGITTDLSLLDTSFIRLCSQRFHAKMNVEENSRRKYRNYYGKKWLQITENLNIGEFVYLNRNTLQKIKVPLFQTTRKPQDINELSKPKREIGILSKIWSVFK